MKLLNEVIHGDCLEIMPYISAKSIDLILADLPYNATQNQWDKMIDLNLLWKEYKRIARDNCAIVLTATQPFAAQLIMSNLKMFRYDLVWIKNKSTGHLNSKKMHLRSHELILIFYKKLPIYNPQKTIGHKPVNSYTQHSDCGSNYGKTKIGLSGGGSTERYPTSILNFPVVNNDSKDKFHPTQKPVPLFEYLIKTYSNPEMTVLDNAAGACTTAIACKNTNRNFICIEKEEKYCDIGRNRLL